MTKRFKQKINSVFSITNIILMILQSFMPGFFAFMPSTAFAAGVKDIGKVDLEFSQESNEFDLNVISSHDLKYLISYDEISLDLENGITGIATSKEGIATASAYAGTCSGDDCIPDKVTTGVLELLTVDFESDFIVDKDTLWLLDGNNAMVPTVNLGVIYSAPQNNEVKVTFTKLPDNPGSLIIEEITLTDEQVQKIGAYSNIAYDITSDMEDGTFEYELKLPLPEGADENAGLVYAESVEELNKADLEEVETFVDLDQGIKHLKAIKLDHFTIFVVVNTDDLPQPPVNDLQLVFDNSDPEYSEVGASWRDSSCNVGYGDIETRVRDPHDNGEEYSAEWEFIAPETATYRLAASWSTHNNRTTNAVYTVFDDNDVQLETASVDQHISGAGCGGHSGFQNVGIQVSLVAGETYIVELTNPDKTAGYLIADAIQLTTIEAPSEVWVDDDWVGQANGAQVSGDLYIGYDAFALIQDGVEQVKVGGTVHVKEGSYQEQVVITKDLDLLGENNPQLVSISNPVAYKLAESSKTFEPIIFAYGGTLSGDFVSGSEQINVVIDGFNIDGDDRLSGGNRSVAVLVRNMNGAINNNVIHSMSIGESETFGIVVYGNSDVRVGENSISEYSRGGISISGDNSSAPDPIAVVINNKVSGPGDDEDVTWAPNGIQVSAGASGVVTDNVVTGNGWPGPRWSGTGILIVDTSNVVVKNNTVHNNEQAIGVVDYPVASWPGTVSNIDVLNNTVTSNSWGLEISNDVTNIVVSGNYFSQTAYNTIEVYTYYEFWPEWYSLSTPPTNVTINLNSIESSGEDGLLVSDAIINQVNANKNWWGDASGPSGDGSGSGETIIGNASYCPWLTTSDIDNPTYAGKCLSYVQGRTFIDQEDNGLLLSADGDHPNGRENGFSVRAYDNDWNLLEEKTTSSTNSLAQYKFENLLDEDTTYRVCGVQREGYVESVPELGQHPVKSNGKDIPKKYSDAVIVTNNSAATDEFSRCWETTLNDDDAAYLAIGYKIATPTQTGYNVNDGDSYETPRNPNDLACTGGVTNINGISVHWTEVGDETSNIKYQRQYNVNGSSSWSRNEVYTNPYTNYRSFGGGAGSEATYGSQVRAWIDSNNNGVVDKNEAVSEWSNICEITYDKTAPATPTGLRRLAREDHSIVFACGDSAQIRHMHPDWDDNLEGDFSHYEYSSFNANGGQGINERRLDDSIFEYNGSWLPGEGTYGFAVRAVDNAGNKSTWALGGTETLEDSCQITYDGTAPDATIDAIKYENGTIEPTKFVTNYSTPTILGTTSSDVASVTLTVNGNTYVASVSGTDWEVDITNVLPEGTQNMVVVATDHVGNVTTINKDIFIDTVAPTAIHTYYQDGSIITNPVAYAQTLGAFTFFGEYSDLSPSSNLYWDSYVIFQAQDDHSFRFSYDGKKAYCGWRSTPNLVDMTSAMSSTFSLTTPTAFTNCVSTIEDGEYYMAHHIYDTATRKDIPSINQFRDVLGLHFIIDTVNPSSKITTFKLENEGETQTSTFDGLIQGTATDTPVDTASGVAKVLLEIKHTVFGETESSYWNGSDWQAGFVQVTATGTTTWEYQIQPEEKVLEGIYNVKSHALDNAGNLEETFEITIVYDKTIPEVSLAIDPVNPDGNNSWYVTEPTVTLTANDNHNVDYIEYQWNSTTGSWTRYTAPINPPGEGQNILYYRSVDVVKNISELGIKEVKFDKTAPTDGAGNLKVRNIKSTTADASWNEPENSDEIVKFVLIWKHEDGKERSKSVDGDVYETDLYDLFDGEWELTLESQDSAGHSYRVTEKFRVGEDPDAGSVLGVIDDVTTGFIAGVSNFISGDTKDKEEEKSDSKTKTETEENDDSGAVLGDSDSECVTWKYYLPLFLLLIQLLFAASLEIANRDPGKKKLMIALGISILTIATFHILRNIDCYADTTGLIQTLAKWFVPISLILAMVFRWLGSMTVEEK